VNTGTRTALVSLLAIALLAWFMRHANLTEVWTHVRTVRVDFLLIGLLFVSLTYVTRTIRWRYLLAPVGDTTFRSAFRTTIIGFAALGILPARAGDVLRPYLLARRDGLNMPATFATVVMERVLDLVAVLALMAVYVWGFSDATTLPPHLKRPIEAAAAIGGAGALLLLVLMWLFATHPERIGSLVYTFARVLPRKMADRLAQMATMFSAGFAAAREPRSLCLAILWSFPLWLVIAADAWIVSRAFGIMMPFTGSFLLSAILVIGVAVPTPGAVGSYHEAYRIAVTTFFHAPNDTAVAAAIVVHAISFIPVVLVGIVFMAQDGISVGRLQQLAGVARKKEMPHSDEVPILRSPGR
jgi:uncharacterized protein (TIRG00374 family)